MLSIKLQCKLQNTMKILGGGKTSVLIKSKNSNAQWIPRCTKSTSIAIKNCFVALWYSMECSIHKGFMSLVSQSSIQGWFCIYRLFYLFWRSFGIFILHTFVTSSQQNNCDNNSPYTLTFSEIYRWNSHTVSGLLSHDNSLKATQGSQTPHSEKIKDIQICQWRFL